MLNHATGTSNDEGQDRRLRVNVTVVVQKRKTSMQYACFRHPIYESSEARAGIEGGRQRQVSSAGRRRMAVACQRSN